MVSSEGASVMGGSVSVRRHSYLMVLMIRINHT